MADHKDSLKKVSSEKMDSDINSASDFPTSDHATPQSSASDNGEYANSENYIPKTNDNKTFEDSSASHSDTNEGIDTKSDSDSEGKKQEEKKSDSDHLVLERFALETAESEDATSDPLESIMSEQNIATKGRNKSPSSENANEENNKISKEKEVTSNDSELPKKTPVSKSSAIKPSSRGKKWLIRSVTIIFCLFLGVVGYIGYNIWGAVNKGQLAQKPSKHRDKPVEIKTDPFTILFIGVDQYSVQEETEELRTDVLMVASINPNNNSVKLISIPRDTLTEIANTNGYKTKINASAYWGKRKGYDPIENVRETVENFLGGIPIDYYAKINFRGFIDLVNAVGGVDVHVPFDFTTSTFGNKRITFKEGPAHLTGEEALPYVRMRKNDPQGDFGRNKRQQEVIANLLDRIVSFQSLTKIDEISDAVGNNLSYTVPASEFMTLMRIYQRIPKENIEILELKTRSERINGAAFEIVSEKERERVSRILKAHLEILPPQELEAEKQDEQSSFQDSKEEKLGQAG